MMRLAIPAAVVVAIVLAQAAAMPVALKKHTMEAHVKDTIRELSPRDNLSSLVDEAVPEQQLVARYDYAKAGNVVAETESYSDFIEQALQNTFQSVPRQPRLTFDGSGTSGSSDLIAPLTQSTKSTPIGSSDSSLGSDHFKIPDFSAANPHESARLGSAHVRQTESGDKAARSQQYSTEAEHVRVAGNLPHSNNLAALIHPTEARPASSTGRLLSYEKLPPPGPVTPAMHQGLRTSVQDAKNWLWLALEHNSRVHERRLSFPLDLRYNGARRAKAKKVEPANAYRIHWQDIFKILKDRTQIHPVHSPTALPHGGGDHAVDPHWKTHTNKPTDVVHRAASPPSVASSMVPAFYSSTPYHPFQASPLLQSSPRTFIPSSSSHVEAPSSIFGGALDTPVGGSPRDGAKQVQ